MRYDLDMPRSLPAQPWTEPLPPASPPSGLSLHRLPTGSYDTRAAFAFRGGSFSDKRHFAATAVLVRHPQGDVLIDAGFGSGVAEHMKAQPRFARAPFTATVPAGRQLADAGYDADRLAGVLLTHAHWDHVSGLDEVNAPIWINDRELDYARQSADGTVFRAVTEDRPVHRYSLDGPAYLGFGPSFDVHGDGSIVVALAGGHTPGSVVVFVTPPDGPRYAFIGDLTWQSDGITRGAERPYLLRRMADDDPASVRDGLSRIMGLAELMRIVPAHDSAAFESIPCLR